MILQLNDFRAKKVQTLMNDLITFGRLSNKVYISPRMGGLNVIEEGEYNSPFGIVLVDYGGSTFVNVQFFLTLWNSAQFYEKENGPNPYTNLMRYLNEISFDRDRIGDAEFGANCHVS